MAADHQTTPPSLDYVTRRPRRRVSRPVIVWLFGAALTALGIAIFAFAHELTETNTLVAEHRRQHEVLVSALAIAIVLIGGRIMVVGLKAWCEIDVDSRRGDEVDRVGPG